MPRHWREAYVPLNVSIGGRSMNIGMSIWGKYGDNWKLVETANTREFYHGGKPIMPPPEWKVMVHLWPIYPPRRNPPLKVVR